MCPQLVLVEQDPAAVEREWEGLLRQLEDSGFAVDPEEPGRVYFETKGVERLYGGLEAALERALASVGAAWDPRAGAAQRRFAPLRRRASRVPGRRSSCRPARRRAFWHRCRSRCLPLPADRYAELEGLGVRRLGELAALPGGAVAERLGREGRQAWGLARGGDSGRVHGRHPAAELAEALSSPSRSGTS